MISLFSPGSYLAAMATTVVSTEQYSRWKRDAIEKVKEDGNLLKDLSMIWRADPEVVEAAILQNPLSLKHATHFQNDKKMVLLAVRINGLARVFASEKLQNDPEVRAVSEESIPKSLPPSKEVQTRENQIFFCMKDKFRRVKDYDAIDALFVSVDLYNSNPSVFLRDSRVTLFGGGYLIPYTIQDQCCQQRLMMKLPEHYNSFLFKEVKGVRLCSFDTLIGEGFLQCNVDQAILTAMELNIPFKRGKTCIEGGNCFLFRSNGVKKALVGQLSIYLSMIALEEQNYFDHQPLPNDEEPALDFYRMARNQVHYQNENFETSEPEETENPLDFIFGKKIEDEYDSIILKDLPLEIAYRELLVAPVSENDKICFRKAAIELQRRFNLTKACMAEDLGLPLQDVIFIPQTTYHIDMELSVTPEGVVFVNDDHQVLQCLKELEEIGNLNRTEIQLLKEYRESAEEKLTHFKELCSSRNKILEENGIEYVTLPAVFESYPSQSSLNYCNGVFASNKKEAQTMPKSHRFTYITTGPSNRFENRFHTRFTEIFHKTFPQYDFYGVPGISHFISKNHGGIHCLTFEGSIHTEIRNDHPLRSG